MKKYVTASAGWSEPSFWPMPLPQAERCRLYAVGRRRLRLFERVYQWNGGWLVLLWMPAITAAAVWATRKWAPGVGGSGIPQVIATLEPSVDASLRKRFVSLWLSFSKIILSSTGFLAGLSIGREGPSVQVAAGVMHSARRWLGPNSAINTHALLVAGGAAGIAAAFKRRWPGWCLPSKSCRAGWSHAPVV